MEYDLFATDIAIDSLIGHNKHIKVREDKEFQWIVFYDGSCVSKELRVVNRKWLRLKRSSSLRLRNIPLNKY